MNCPYCNEEMKTTGEPSVFTCSGPSYAPHDAIDWDDIGHTFQTQSLPIVTWFRENGFSVTSLGSAYQARQKKGILSRILQR